MFKKPLGNLKTSAPLRSSDRRKFKQRIVNDYGLSPEDGELLVPEGLLSQKFSTHVNEPGIVYLSAEGDPLWFSVGKGSDALIPTVYTLWKRPELLPILSTPAAVVPKLIDGADLMIPGVVQHSAGLLPDQLVSVTQYHREKLGPPLAVGRMAVSAETLRRADKEDIKGKAAIILHTWRDSLWDLGSSKKLDVPEPRDLPPPPASSEGGEIAEAPSEDISTADVQSNTTEPVNADPGISAPTTVSPEQPSVAQVEPETPTTQPTLTTEARPAQALGAEGLVDASVIDIKHSTFKTVKTFLKACAKEGLVKLKESKADILVTGVSAKHPAVVGHKSHRTVQSIDAQREKAEARQRNAQAAEEKRKTQIQIIELWKPHGSTLALCTVNSKSGVLLTIVAADSTSTLLTVSQIREVFLKYVATKNLVNANDQSYINISEDVALSAAVLVKNEETPEFMKRDDTLNRIRANMQEWYEMRTEGGETLRKKGQVKPVSIEAKVRQGRKTSTFITSFEHFGIDATELAEELRKVIDQIYQVSPLQGKANELEIMVQGIHTKTVTDLLIAKGVPAKWIKSSGLKEKKK
ncbi:hypothetical protein EIP86_002589 [Pleurotus ostreatoroseus]|nr:hypothetical protein EIP86_002589 [Pleurotus ostreatoroseus]